MEVSGGWRKFHNEELNSEISIPYGGEYEAALWDTARRSVIEIASIIRTIALMMEFVSPYETSASFYETARRSISGNSRLQEPHSFCFSPYITRALK